MTHRLDARDRQLLYLIAFVVLFPACLIYLLARWIDHKRKQIAAGCLMM